MDELGFWIAFFQADPSRDRVKVWLDGDENYQFFSIEDFVDLGKSTGMIIALREACRDYSFFIWDVAEKSITRTRFTQPPDSLRKELVGIAPEVAQPASIAERYWKTDTDAGDDVNAPKIRV